MNSKWRWLCPLALLLSLFPPAVNAFSYVMMRDTDLLAGSDVVVTARVLEHEPVNVAGHIRVTRYRLAVEQSFKTDAPGKAGEIDVLVLGTPRPQSGALWLESAPHLASGSRALWMLNRRDDGSLVPAQHALGVFEIRRVDGVEYAIRDLHGRALTSPRTGYREPSPARDWKRFRALLQNPAAATKRSDGHFVHDRRIVAELLGQVHARFNFLSSSGRVFRWPIFDTGGSIDWSRNGGDDYVAEIDAALAAWNNATGSNIAQSLVGVSTDSGGLAGADSRNTILFEDPNGEIGGSYDCDFGGTLGIGGPRAIGTHTVDDVEYWSNVEGDVVLQDGVDCFLSLFDRANAAELIAHEVGHALGFDHSNEDDAIMRAQAEGGGRGARLGDDDIAGAAALYPSGALENAIPTLTTLSDISLEEGETSETIAITVADSDGVVDDLQLTAVSSNATVMPVENIVFGGSAGARTMVLTAAQNGAGISIVTVTVSDGEDTASDSFVVNVTAAAVNQAPLISAIDNISIDINTSTGLIEFTVEDPDGDASALILSADSNNTSLIPVDNILFGGSGTERTILITPAADQVGVATITLRADDGENFSVISFNVNVNAVVIPNQPPQISAFDDVTIAVDESTASIEFSIEDPDHAASLLTVSGSSSDTVLVADSGIVFSGSGGERSLVITPLARAMGEVTITVTVSDGSLSDSSDFVLRINDIGEPNTAPQIAAIDDVYVRVDSGTVDISVLLSDADGDVDALILLVDAGDSDLLGDDGIELSGSGAERTLSLSPIIGATGVVDIVLSVSDGEDSSNRTFRFGVVDPLRVASLADSGPGSLRDSIAEVEAGEVIGFDSSVFPVDSDRSNNSVIELLSPLVISEGVHIDGDIDGDGIADVTLRSSTGILQLQGGESTLRGLDFAGSDAERGGAISVDGGAQLSLEYSLLENNSALFGGAIVVLDGDVELAHLRFENNSANVGGAIAVLDTAGTVSVDSSSFVGNQASTDGGALYNLGADTMLSNVTISDNSAARGAGLFNSEAGSLALNNVTVYDNGLSGVRILGGSASIDNSILAGSIIDLNVSSGSVESRFSLIEVATGNFADAGGNIFNTDPGLAPLAFYEGLTRAKPPLSDSPVLDAADPNDPADGGSCAPLDQFGKVRPIDADGDGGQVCDMGAYEFSASTGAPASDSSVARVQEQYVAFYGRAGDPTGVQFWATRLDQRGGELGGIQAEFGNSEEFRELVIPEGATTVEELDSEQRAELINNLYQNMFGRDVEGSAEDPGTGLGFWVAQLENPAVSLIDISTRVADGAQNDDRVILDSRVSLSIRITEAFAEQSKTFSETHIAAVRSFLFNSIDDAGDIPDLVDVDSFVANLPD